MMADGGDASMRPSLKRERDDEADSLKTMSTPQNPKTYAIGSGPPIAKLNFKPGASPAGSTTSSSGLSDAPSSNPSPAANAFSSLNGSAPPPAKKPKLSFQEKELDKQRKAIEKMEREQAKARRDAERDEVKRKAAAEREIKKAEAEAAREEKEKEKEKEKNEILEKKRKKEAEKAAKEEKKRAEQRRQKPMTSFFTKAPPKTDTQQSASTSPGPENVSDEKKGEVSYFDTKFQDFFDHHGVTRAPFSRWERDTARLEFVQNTIDKALYSDVAHSEESKKPTFDAQELFGLPGNDFRQRGKTPRPIRDIMAEMNKSTNLSTDSQNTQILLVKNLLSTIPYKFLQFYEDVRPPYRGTFTRPLTPGTAVRLARKPLRRELPEVDYDYDSEAEWADDPGDDLGDTDGEDDDADGHDDMDDFLDNTGQDDLDSKHSMVLEPVSSGLCWEDRRTRNFKGGAINKQMYRYQMEIIQDSEDLSKVLPIDPFSTKYWPEEVASTPPATIGLMNPPPLPLSISKNTNVNVKGSANTKKAGAAPTKLISADKMQRFRDLVLLDEYNEYTKETLIEVLYTKFDKHETKKALKATLEAVARKESRGGKWILIDEA